MLESIKAMLGMGPKIDFAELVKNGAQIIDVRSEREYQSGHIKGSINMPVEKIAANIDKLKNMPTITCCASGMRSSRAKGILKSNGFNDVYNGGGWAALNTKI